MIARLAILGVGLLGGSIGLAVRQKINDCRIVGYGHRRESLDRAIEMGAIDEGHMDAAAAVLDADLVILCTPVLTFAQVIRTVAPALKAPSTSTGQAGAVVTDVGSTKASVCRLAGEVLPAGVSFVGSHPIAGSEKRGVEFARADLFEGAVCIVTGEHPTNSTSNQKLTTSNSSAGALVEDFWRLLGMRIVRMTPAEHDRALARVSHLPHAVAAALVAMQSDPDLAVAGKGFMDTTRIAGGDGALWRDIFVDNAAEMRAAIAELRGKLEEFERMLVEPERLRAWLDEAARRRGSVGESRRDT